MEIVPFTSLEEALK